MIHGKRFSSRFRRVSRLAALSAAATLTATVGLAAPVSAAAAKGGVYIVAPKWWEWCPNIARQNNQPRHMSQSNFTTGNSSSDSGDDIIWSRVALNQNNRIAVQVGCTLGHGSTGTQITIRPTRNGQTWFISLSGGTSAN